MGRRAFQGRIFDADNHLYETEDAFTRHLPRQYEGIFKYVQVHGRTKIAVDNVISEAQMMGVNLYGPLGQ